MADTLSHYTTKHGFIGIVRSQSLWATDFLSLDDTSEFMYATSAIYEAAIDLALKHIPKDLIDPTKNIADVQSLPNDFCKVLKAQLKDNDGYGSLYVTSFARGKNSDEDERGILTLWHRFTNNEGYCVQFEERRVRQLIEFEATKYSYAYLDLVEVKYGLDTKSGEFKTLVRQMMKHLLMMVYQHSRDSRLEPFLEDMDVPSVFSGKFLGYCGRHKDPAFKDEREIRVLACPLKITEARVFTGVTVQKSIHRQRNKRYIALGEHVLPGFVPNRFIIGPKANMDSHMLDALYPRAPKFTKSTIPLR